MRDGGEYQLCAAEEPEGESEQPQLVAKEMSKRENCKKALPSAEKVVGFSDDSHFYIMNGSHVFSFEKDAIGEKVEKAVPYSLSPMSSVVVSGEPPGGGEESGSHEDPTGDVGHDESTSKY